MSNAYRILVVMPKDYGSVVSRACFKRIKKDSFAWYRKVIQSNGADLAD